MRILSLGGITLYAALRAQGHAVRAIVRPSEKNHPDDLPCDYYASMDDAAGFVAAQIEDFRPDAVIVGDCGYPLLHLGIERIGLPVAWYAIDTHLHPEWHRHFAPLVDLVFCAQQNRVAELRRYQPRVEWLPLYGPAGIPFLPWERRTIDVSFVGTIDPKTNPERAALFDELHRHGVDCAVRQGSYVEVYRTSRAVINQAINDDLNLRFFEAPACGALLITEKLSHSMNGILDPETQYLWYERGDINGLIERISWTLGHPAQAEAMALSAHREINERHTELHRSATMLAHLQALVNGPRAPRTDPLPHLARALQICSRMGYPEAATRYFQTRSLQIGQRLLNDPKTRSWGALILALHHTGRGAFDPAYEAINQVSGLPDDPDLRLRYYVIKAMAGLARGDRRSGRDAAEQGLREFPGHAELVRIRGMLTDAN